MNGGGGTALIKATAAFAGAAVKGTAVGQTTLEITNAGTVTLNAGDTHAIIKLDAASHLTLNGMGFITAVGQVAGNTITAAASNQTLGGLAGGDSLLGFSGFGDTFLGSSAGLNGDTIGGFGGAGALADKIDLTDLAPTASLGYAGNTTQGVLTLNDGTHHASITMLGDFSQSGFHVATDGHAGSFITYT